jgi:hypothetical protein
MTKRDKIARLVKHYWDYKAQLSGPFADQPWATADEQREAVRRIVFDIWLQLRRLGHYID